MAEMANVLAAASYNQQSGIYAEDITSSPVGHHGPRAGIQEDASFRDRDSGVFLSDKEDTPSPPTSRPSSIVLSVSLKQIPSATSTPSPQRADSTAHRLRRPAELNLGNNKTTDPSKPKSELELRYDLIRNSQNQSKAALKSPTQLLQDRLNLSPKKGKHEEKVRIFTPPQPMLNGCILPGPAAQLQAFTGSSVRAKTEKTGRPAWWCKFDKVVVFDGVEENEDGELKFQTRTSKGLTIARRRGDTESVVIPLDCSHCQEMLNRHEWKYDVQVCRRVVCWDCRERCRWEMEQEAVEAVKEEDTNAEAKAEANRERADSVLQGEQAREEELRIKSGIECAPETPVTITQGSVQRWI